jgi:hypothetical protein
VTESELHVWLKTVTRKQIMKDVEVRWDLYKDHKDIEHFLDLNYGTLKNCNCFLKKFKP